MSIETDYEITWLIRRIFRQMARVAGENLEAFDITAADRAVLEFLFQHEALSVPEIAERYDVSRQHVQVTVNALLDKRLVTKKANPRHKRSDLIGLSAAGKKCFRKVRQQDAVLVEALFAGIPERQLTTTLNTLKLLNKRLNEGTSK